MSISCVVCFTTCQRAWTFTLALALIWGIGPCHGRLGSGGVTSLTASNFESFVQKSARVMVDFYNTDGDQTEMEKALRQVRGLGHTVPFAKLDAARNPEIAQKYVSHGTYPQLVWFQHGEVTQYHRTLRQSEDISTFVMALDREPILIAKNIDDAFGMNRAVFIQAKKASTFYKELEVVASKHMDMVAFFQLESPNEEVQWLANDAIVDTYIGNPTAAAIDRWVQSMLTVSDEIPDQLVEDGSTVVVGKTFEENVLREDKDVFLFVYASWCGFCKKIEPAWKSLALEMSDVEHLVVAKIDGGHNKVDFDAFKWESYPTFYYVRAGEKVPTLFDGNRTLDGLLRFAQEHSTQAITINFDSVTETPKIDL